jgi:hypothetical protein
MKIQSGYVEYTTAEANQSVELLQDTILWIKDGVFAFEALKISQLFLLALWFKMIQDQACICEETACELEVEIRRDPEHWSFLQ